jgi:DNA anti-recombination protein RmuC
MNKPPVAGPKPAVGGHARRPGPGMHMDSGMPFGPPMDPKTEELNRHEMKLDRECVELASRLRRAAKDERENLTKQLTEAVNKHFDVRQKRRELQLQHLEDELKRLRKANQKRIEAREQLVNRRLADLLGQPDDLRF